MRLVIWRDHGTHTSLEDKIGFSAVEDALGRAHVREAYPPNVVHAREMPFGSPRSGDAIRDGAVSEACQTLSGERRPPWP